MIPINVYMPVFPARKNGITIYPFIFWSKKRKGWKNPAHVAHEMYHWNEQLKWKKTRMFGLSQWLIKYIYLWAKHNVIKNQPSREHPMEKPAYDAENRIAN